VSLIDTLARAKQTGDYQALLDAVPYSRFLGLSAALAPAPERDGFTPARGEAELITTMRYADHLIGNPALPALHGGTLGALLESAAIFELLWRAETVVLPKTITFTVDYLRSGGPLDTHARGIVTRHGRRVANVRVEAWQGKREEPIATAHAIFLVMRAEPAATSS
jgi:acyl-coenzyme A thioesterase PaaI-like protein